MNEQASRPRQPQPNNYDHITRWGIFKYFEFWGWVELTDKGLVFGGPDPEKVENLLDSMRGNRTDAELFASLPKRLTGVIHVGPADYKPEDHPEHKFD